MYIHQTTCISPQQTFSDRDLTELCQSENNRLIAREPKYTEIPLGILRRMGKAVRMGVGAALSLLQSQKSIDGIIIGTANGGMEDCIKFLNQIMEYEEGRLTPTNFVQSTPNAIAAQIGLSTQNTGYNITHVHRGLAFENALLDAMMKLNENPDHTYLLGGLDEISDYNFSIEYLAGAYKTESVNNKDLYSTSTPGTIAGEGVAMFSVNNNSFGSKAKVLGLKMVHTKSLQEVQNAFKLFLSENKTTVIDLLITGENGDSRLKEYYDCIENECPKEAGILRFKHYCGEFPTASAIGLWLACQFIENKQIPNHFIKRKSINSKIRNIFIYNNYKGYQHSFILVEGNF
jgi:hypothetical protein